MEVFKSCHINWLIEPIPMDTGRTIVHAVKEMHLNGDFLVTNVDTWLGGGIQILIDAASPAMAVLKLADVSRYGQVHFDYDVNVIAFSEKNGRREPGWINARLCHLHAELFKDWDGNPFSLERKLFPELLKNRSLSAIRLETDFIDIGVPDDYYRFCRWVKSGCQVSL